MAAEQSVVTSFRALDRVSSAFARMSRAGNKFGNTAQDAFRRASKSGSMFQSIVGGNLVAGAISNVTSRLYEFAKGSIDLASDLIEVQNVVDTTFGPEGAKQINDWSNKSMKAFGISTLQAKQFTGSMGAMLKSSGLSGNNIIKMSTGLAGLAGDFASFYNLPHDVAWEKIRSGISGETEPLKQLGINMSVANLEAFALTKGITKQWKAMTQAEQVQLRYNYLMAQSKDAQGDFAKTLSSSMANQRRVLETNIKMAGAAVVSKLIPLLTKGMDKINTAMDKINWDKVSSGIETAVNIFIGLGKALLFISPIIPHLVFWMLAYNAAIKAQLALGAIAHFLKFTRVFLIMAKAKGIATAAQWAFNAAVAANPIGLMVAGIAALISGLFLVVKYWDNITEAISKAIDAVSTFLGLQTKEEIQTGATARMEKQAQIQKNYDLTSNDVFARRRRERGIDSAGNIIPPGATARMEKQAQIQKNYDLTSNDVFARRRRERGIDSAGNIIPPNQNQAAAVKNSMNVNVNTNVNAPEGYKVDTSVKSRPVSGNMGVNK